MRPYLARVIGLDITAIVLAVAIGILADPTVLTAERFLAAGAVRPTWALALLWVVCLVALSTYDGRLAGSGPDEYRRVVGAAMLTMGVLGTLSYLFGTDAARRFLVVALLVGVAIMLLGRIVMRTWLARARENGRYLRRTLVVGQGRYAEQLAERLREDAFAGYEVVDEITGPAPGQTVEEWLDSVECTLATLDVDAVAVAELSGIDSDLVRRLAWRLEGPRVDLMVSPGLSDLAGPRMTIRPASGVPLIHLDEPQLQGPKAVIKRAVDIIGASVILILLSPLLVLTALVTKVTSRGPVFYTQQRVGQHGVPFSFLKFRTMVVGAHDMRDDVIGDPDADITERYRTDPRITPFGRVLRRWSIDELPQLIHVVTGEMSLVGPRPLLVDELPLLVDADHRRHMTKPGLTGLWQVSGRKEVTWEERMRLDLWYVENWSPGLDAVIVLRTVRAVVTGHGAY